MLLYKQPDFINIFQLISITFPKTILISLINLLIFFVSLLIIQPKKFTITHNYLFNYVRIFRFS